MLQEEKNTFHYVEENSNETIPKQQEQKTEANKIKKGDVEDFVAGLPDWDLLPPYEVIKRVNRK